MKLAFWLVPFVLASAATAQSQTFSNDATYTVQGATPQREAVLRHQIQLMQPSVLPYRGSASCLTGNMCARPRCTNSTCPPGWEAKCLLTWPAGAFSLMKIPTSVRSGSAIGWPTNLATWRPVVSRKKTRKEQPGNTGPAYKQRLREADLQVLRTKRPARKPCRVLVEIC